ncbi:MAG: TrmO family methyltransferase [Methanoculleus sp.]
MQPALITGQTRSASHAFGVIGVSGGTIRVRELDALDGTLVLDIKPYS